MRNPGRMRNLTLTAGLLGALSVSISLIGENSINTIDNRTAAAESPFGVR